MTDAAHMFSDFGTFCISMLALYIAKKEANQRRTFGLYRAGNFNHTGYFLRVVWDYQYR